jgi:hypothetical protein
MTGRPLVAVALLPALVLALSACGGSGTKLYDAKATYACLRNRPEYRPIASFSWYPGEPGVRIPPVLAYYMATPPPRGARYAGNWPFRGPNVGASWGFGVVPVRPPDSGGPVFPATRIAVFDEAKSARAAYQASLRRALGQPRLLATARKLAEIHRNVLLDWDYLGVRKQQIRSIVLGCLRTA